MNTGTVLLIAGVAIVGVILLTSNSPANYGPYVPPTPARGDGDLAAGANAVGSFLSNSSQQFFGAAQAFNLF